MFIYNQTRSSVTVIDNRFIDVYMTEASGEFVKVYLYLLRLSQDPGRDFGIAELADGLETTEKDIIRGLRYWEKQGLLSLEMSVDGAVMGVRILPVLDTEIDSPENPLTEASSVTGAVQEEPVKVNPAPMTEKMDAAARQENASAVAVRPRAKVEELPVEAIAELQSQEEFREVLFVAEAYLGRALTPKDIQLFGYLYDELHFPKDLLEYLVEYCVDGGHKSYRYMETVALNWHQEGKMSVEAAKESAKAYSRENKVVMNAFGIVGRILNNEERGYVEKWTKVYDLPLELVEEACNITMATIQKASFSYADKILTDWHDAGVRTLEDSRTYRENRKNNRAQGGEKAVKPAVDSRAGKNRFQNYQQRNMDYDALIQQGEWNPYGSESKE